MKYINRVYRVSVLDRAAAFKNLGLSGHHVSYILHVCRKPGMTQEELAASLFVHKSSITRQVNRLEQANYVERRPDADDRRVKRIFPTALAEETYPKIIDYLEGWNDVLTHELNKNEEEELLTWLKCLAKRSTEHLVEHNLGNALGLEMQNEEENA